MASLAPPLRFSALDANGNPAAGWKVYTYAAGTSTPKDSYTSSSASVANTNPVVLNSRGEATIWLSGTYKISVKTAADVLVYEEDNISDGTVNGTFTNATFAGTLTVSSTSVTWSGNPTHSGNHTFSGNVSFNGNTTIGNASGDALTVSPNTVTWSNNPTHSGNHTWSGNQAMSGTLAVTGETTLTAGFTSGVSFHNTDGAIDGPSGEKIKSGSYTPTATAITNVASCTGRYSSYIRVGKIVHVFGLVDVDPTAATTNTGLYLSLPISATISDNDHVSGTASMTTGAENVSGTISANIAASTTAVILAFVTAANVASQTWKFSFSYLVE